MGIGTVDAGILGYEMGRRRPSRERARAGMWGHPSSGQLSRTLFGTLSSYVYVVNHGSR
jgi:hypothetical protein